MDKTDKNWWQKWWESRKNRVHRHQLAAYWQVVPLIWQYQIVTKAVLVLGVLVFEEIFSLLLASTGRVALSSGDWQWLFVSWQGWLLLYLGFGMVFLYTVFDLFAKVIFSDQLLRGEMASWRDFVVQVAKTSGRFANWRGLLVIGFVVVISPLVGMSMSVSLTRELYIPNFISSVIQASPLLNGLYILLQIAFLVIGWMHIFVFHGVLIDDMSVKDAAAQSRRIMRENWRAYIWENVKFTLRNLVPYLVIIAILAPPLVLTAFVSAESARAFLIFWCLLGKALMTLVSLLVVPFYIMMLTQLYYRFAHGEEKYYQPKQKRRHLFLWLIGIVVLEYAGIVGWYYDYAYDTLLGKPVTTQIVAHRGGGRMATENTLSGMREAIARGIYGAEFDVQRTSDGVYIVNHDVTLKRVTGDTHRSWQLSWPEIQQLRVYDSFYPEVSGEPVARLEEMLDTAKGNLVPFIELKGETADRQMATDVVHMLQERDMIDEAVIISLNYDVIEYIEQNWPEVFTGLTLSVSIGDTANLDTDILLIEEELASSDVIAQIHEQGKMAMVWTVNQRSSQEHFLQTSADVILTDEVDQALGLIEALNGRSMAELVWDKIINDNNVNWEFDDLQDTWTDNDPELTE